MEIKNKLKDTLKDRIIVLDGATGTELQKRGMPRGACPELWCLDNPEVLSEVHAAYADAGADIVYTCTFGANRFKLEQYGAGDVERINRDLAGLARAAVKENVLVAGDIGPGGHFVHPFGTVSFEDAVDACKRQVRGLLAGGVDLFVIETMMDIQEARAALIAVRELTDKFVIVTMTYEKNGRTLNGTDPCAALVTLQSMGADAVGCNCSVGPEEMRSLIEKMKPYATVPLVAKPNAGLPRLINEETVFDMDAGKFASFAGKFAVLGANMIGGCCGTTPLHIKAFKDAVASEAPVAPHRVSLSAVSSAQSAVFLEKEDHFYIIGERINPTGKKGFQEELRTGSFKYVRAMAKEQSLQGAALLDVNVSVPDSDEKKIMGEALSLLSAVTSCPLVIDSSDADVIESALRVYPGRALINSVSAEKGKMERLFSLAAKYGAMCVLLPVTDRELPATCARRKEIVSGLVSKAEEYGLTGDDIVVDALAMSVSSSPGAARETLATIEWCTRGPGLHTVVGLSNISFGLPCRKWINAAFLAQARTCGLRLAIMNPADRDTAFPEQAKGVLTGEDKDARGYIAWCRKSPVPEQRGTSSGTGPCGVFDCIVEGNREDIVAAVEKDRAEGVGPRALLNEKMIPAITRVGELYDRKEYYLPQLIASAETMKKGFEYLKPFLEKDTPDIGRKIVVLMATVRGDIHDIGKNIVALLLQNYGYTVIDLGNDVSAEKIVQSIKKYNPAVVGLSALMTTTMVNMKEVIALAKKEKLACQFIVGGAVVTDAYARSLGVAYARDGVDAVRTVGRLTE